jgi:hypothetical protein
MWISSSARFFRATISNIDPKYSLLWISSTGCPSNQAFYIYGYPRPIYETKHALSLHGWFAEIWHVTLWEQSLRLQFYLLVTWP